MSNLSDLIPAGGGQNNTDFVADGAITSGKPVILTAAGKAAEVGESAGSETLGSPADASGAVTIGYGMAGVRDAASGKMVIVYVTSGGVYAVVGTISGTTNSWGTPVNAYSGTADNKPAICYDSVTEQVIIAYQVQSAQTYVITGKVSATTISFGTAVSVDSTTGMGDFTVAYNVGDSKGLVIYGSQGEASNSGRAKVITVTGTAISLGTVNNWNTSGHVNNNHFCSTYDSNAGSIVFANQSTANSGKAAVFTISGTTVSAGTFTQYTTGNTTATSITYDSTAQKVVTASRQTTTTYGYAAVGTVSGTSISFGSPVAFNSAAVVAASVCCAYGGDSANVTNILFTPTTDNYLYYINGTVSGTSISFNTEARAYSDNATSPRAGISTATSGKVLFIINPSSTVGGLTDNFIYGAVLQNVATTTNLTATNLLGIASGAILDTATGTINTWGSRNEVQTSLTIASDYYAQEDGTITTTSTSPAQLLGKALSATMINIKDYTG